MKSFTSFLMLNLFFVCNFQVLAQRAPVKSKTERGTENMHPSVEAQTKFTKMDEVIGFKVEDISVTMNYTQVAEILKSRGWLQLDVDVQNNGLIFYKGERMTVNGSPNSLYPKPGTTMYKLIFRTAGQATTLFYLRQHATALQRSLQKPYQGPIPSDAKELPYVKKLKALVCSGYTDEIMIKRYCNKPDTDDLAGFGSKTVPVFNSLEEKLSVRAMSSKLAGMISISYYHK